MRHTNLILGALLLGLTLTSCTRHKSEAQLESEKRRTTERDKLAEADRKAAGSSTVDPNKVQIIDLVVGQGAKATNGRSLSMHYTGRLLDGTVFDSSRKPGRGPFKFKLGVGQVIKGWDKGVLGMRVGGKRKLIIPASMGYGARGSGSSIPPNATLIFEIELMGVR